MSKKILTAILILLMVASYCKVIAQTDETKKEGYTFTEKIRIPCSPVKNQYRSSTCWSYSALSLLESEMIRQGKGTYDLSEAFIIRYAYLEKAEKYTRFQGNINLGGGGAFHDVIHIISKYGIVPNEVYDGLVIGEENFVHGEMDEVFKTFMEGVVKNKNGKLSPAWHKAFEGMLDAYLGVIPDKFTYNGKEYTPTSFAESLGLKLDDYVEIGSYSHHPYYERFILEVPDNWMLEQIYNVPLDDMITIIDHSLEQGYSVGWGADISEKGFSWSNGVAIVPDEEKPDLTGTEKEKWEKLTTKEKNKMMYNFEEPAPEKNITQDLRQIDFDNYSTTDDHGMEFVGLATDQKGNNYYIVKNSWGTDQKYDGFFYASVPYVRYKTIDIFVNKNVIPKDIRKKLGL